jgi:hypothetical protein
MMWIGAGITVLGSLSSFLFMDQVRDDDEEQLMADGQVVSESTLDAAVTVGLVVGFVVALVTAALWAWMAVANGKGRSWARIVATVFASLGVLFGLLGLVGAGLGGTTGTSVPGLVQNLITMGLAVGITALLWSGKNADFYRRRPAAARRPDQDPASSRCRWACCPSRSNTMISSATSSTASTAWGVMVENSAASPSTTSTTRSPRVRRPRPLRTNNPA